MKLIKATIKKILTNIIKIFVSTNEKKISIILNSNNFTIVIDTIICINSLYFLEKLYLSSNNPSIITKANNIKLI